MIFCDIFLQGVQAATDVVFPSRVLKRQLDDAQSRLKEMEKELVLVKSKDKREKKRQKRMGVSLIVPLLVCNLVYGLLFDPTYPQVSTETIPYVQTSPVPPMAPPPPPPPPPPSVPVRRIVTRSKTTKLQKIGQKLPSITLDDIKKVKLRNVTEKTDMVNHCECGITYF